MGGTVLITGANGLIGHALGRLLPVRGWKVTGLDIRGKPHLNVDVRNLGEVSSELKDVGGIIHLAAVSRVIDGERYGNLCRSVNVEGTREVLRVSRNLPRRPWVIVASSREVYGEQLRLPVSEDAPLAPLNTYARSKTASEDLVARAAMDGARAAIVRLSNVYGSVYDYSDRVVPAFARAACTGGALRVDGQGSTFDFTYLEDVVDGIARMADLLEHGEVLPPIHLVSGHPTTLEELAALAVEYGRPGTRITRAPARSFDVQRFFGDPARAREILGWRAVTDIRAGLRKLVDAFHLHLETSSDFGETRSARSALPFG